MSLLQKRINVLLKSSELANDKRRIDYIKKLAKVEDLKADLDNVAKPKASASSVVKSSGIYVPLEGLIDLDVEETAFAKRNYTFLEGFSQEWKKKLSNEEFVGDATC
ncbi:MAG: hypothetical protein U5J96_12260 [Ignavibacteriaceae bacterium]|nr:hypothetical protein [Ignavibacteriaceae bacterium]